MKRCSKNAIEYEEFGVCLETKVDAKVDEVETLS